MVYKILINKDKYPGLFEGVPDMYEIKQGGRISKTENLFTRIITVSDG